jgi:4-hydroxy-tetrahydrodipicolinate synthase
MIAMCQAFAAARNEEACRLHHKLFHLCRDLLGLSTNPIPIKAAMKLLGRDTGEMRLPMTELDAASEAKLRSTLQKYGLL